MQVVGKKSFVLYTDFGDFIDVMTDEQAGELFRAIIQYEQGKEPDIQDPSAKIAFVAIKQRLDVDNQKWEDTKRARAEAGKKGAEARWENDKQEANDDTDMTNDGKGIERDDKQMTEADKNGCNMLYVKCNMLSTIVDKYNELCPSLPKCIKLTDYRKTHIKARLKVYDMDTICTAFQKAEASDFLSGRSGEWRASFDWLINENNLVKVLEGKYDNRTRGGTGVHSRLQNAFEELKNE